jgi:uncharacterized membrane protein YeaQ/YmgE (transglycosylase-associated protein family)
MGIIILLILGAVIGSVASRTMKTNGSMTTNIIIGVTGAFIGGYIMEHSGYIGIGGAYGFSMYSVLVAIVSACILLAVVNLIQR